MTDFESEWTDNGPYLKMLGLIGSLSNLFSESRIPFIHYRVTENLFCKYFNAENLSRTDTAYDARIGNVGFVIKTFQLKSASNSSIEKIAEFNALSPELRQLSGKELALRLAHYRNERMAVANRLYEINRQIYHVIGRREGKLTIFNSPYDPVNIAAIHDIRENAQSLRFKDDRHEYTFNKSKSVLMKRFVLPDKFIDIDIDIISDPYSVLESLLTDTRDNSATRQIRPHVFLPLYSTRKAPVGVEVNASGKWVPLKSGLNQWNAAGRSRDLDEVYIPIPSEVHKNLPAFFPPRHTSFSLRLPDGNVLKAKICQTNNKGLMTNPNKALGDWILRKVLGLLPGEILTIGRLDTAGFDSVVVYRNGELDYSIDVINSSSGQDNGFLE